jgi:pimeloyl-ACP methyl ester carboxylesterase
VLKQGRARLAIIAKYKSPRQGTQRAPLSRTAAYIALFLGLSVFYGCSAIGLPNVGTNVTGEPATPAVLAQFEGDAAVSSAQDWELRRKPLLRSAVQSQIYGRFPSAQPVTIIERIPLTLDIANLSQAEQWVVQIGEPSAGLTFSMIVLLPKADVPAPLLIMQNFCGNALTFKNAAGVNPPHGGNPKDCQNPVMLPLVPVIFGGAIMHPPFDKILAAGYGVAVLYAGDVVPDEPVEAEKVLTRLTPPGTPKAERTGAIAAWAWTYLRAMDALATQPKVDQNRISLWGHSRNGKSALLAAALDPRPYSVIALQAGTAGGSLGRDDVGESIAKITQSFPHWFAPNYATWASRQSQLPIDQHQLLAMIAPRPVLLASARRDRWSDPHGAVRAAAGASPVYELYGKQPFSQTDLRKPDYGPSLVTYMRPGLHGVHTEDWDKALTFLAEKSK